MAVSTSTISPDSVASDRLERWLERYGGWLVAVVIHLAIIAVFCNQLIIIKNIAKPRDTLSIRFSLPEPPPPPPKPVLPMVLPMPSVQEAVATVSDPNAKDPEAEPAQTAPQTKGAEATVNEPASAASAAVEAAGIGRPVLPPDMTKEIQKELARLNQVKASQELSHDEVRTQVHKLEAEARGRQFTIDSDGGRQGAIRTLDVSTVPEDVVLQVFRIYHIRIDRHRLSSEQQPSFLNAAVTEEGTFRSAPVQGPQDVFVLSPTAIAMMSSLESRALLKRGFDPHHTRVMEIQFGIVKNEKNEWDLGVTKLVTEEVR